MGYVILTTRQKNWAFQHALITLMSFRSFTNQKTPGMQGIHIIVYYYLVADSWHRGTVSRQDILDVAATCGFQAASAIAQMTTKQWLMAIPGESRTLYWIHPDLVDKSLTKSYVTKIINGRPRKVCASSQFLW